MLGDAQGRGALVPRLSLSSDEAAQSLGVSRDHFDRHVLPHVKAAHIGRRKVIPVRELERFLAERGV